MAGVVRIWQAESHLDKNHLDIGLPEELISEFRSRFKGIFGRIAGLWDYPPEIVWPDGTAIYSCLGSEQAGHHVDVTIDNSEKKKFRGFLHRFCKKYSLYLSPLNSVALYA